MNLDELERTLLEAARSDLSPSFVDRERHQMELLARLDGAQPWQGLPNAPRPVKASAWRALGSREFVSGAPLPWARWKLLSVGLALGALLGGLIGFGLGRGSQTGHGPSDGAHAVSTPGDSKTQALGLPAQAAHAESDLAGSLGSLPSEHGGPAIDPLGEGSLPTADLEAADDASPAATDGLTRAHAAASASKGRRHGAARRQLGSSSAAVPESSLGIELSMLQRARRALNADNGRLALGIVQELDERFPAGILLEERNATRILSLCKLDRAEEARRVAGAFLGRYPESVYAARVRESCASRVAE